MIFMKFSGFLEKDRNKNRLYPADTLGTGARRRGKKRKNEK